MNASEQFDLFSDGGGQKIQLTFYAGHSAKDGHLCQQAESFFLKALYMRHSVLKMDGKSCFEPNQKLESYIWKELVDLYLLSSDWPTEYKVLGHVLMALLLQCGWSEPENFLSEELVQEIPAAVLLPQYLNNSVTSSALFSAFEGYETPESIRFFLLSVVGPNAESIKLVATPEWEDEYSNSQYNKKKHIRSLMKKAKTSGKTLPLCIVCREFLKKNLECPCHTVSYCSKKCQAIHWKSDHKQVCPYRRAQKSQ
jgi:hypothetical protein